MNHSIEQWFQLYEKDVTSFLIYFTGTMDVEDLVQDTFLTAMKKMANFKDQSHPKTWLISIARNRVIDLHRRRKLWDRMKHLFVADPTFTHDPEMWLAADLDKERLHKAINLLSPRYREVVIMRGILEMTPNEVANVLKSTENNVNVLYHRSLKKLKELVGEEEGIL